MSDRNPFLKRVIRCLILLFSLALLGCGQGGTEVGNPNQPIPGKIPAGAGGDSPEAAPALEGPSPSPSPQALLLKNSETEPEDSEDSGALILPEENS